MNEWYTFLKYSNQIDNYFFYSYPSQNVMKLKKNFF